MTLLDKLLIRTSIEKGHFIFASGNHSDRKLEFDNISKHNLLLNLTSRKLAKSIAQNFPQTEVVVTVASGSNVLAVPVAKKLSKILGRKIQPIQTSKDSAKNFHIKAKLNPNTRCVILDDVFNHGTNSAKVETLLESKKLKVLGTAVVFNRNKKDKARLLSLVNYELRDWPPEECDCQRA